MSQSQGTYSVPEGDSKERLLHLLDIAEQRYAKLKRTVHETSGELDGIAIQFAIDDAITPLRIALEFTENL